MVPVYGQNCSLKVFRYTHTLWDKMPSEKTHTHTWSCKDTHKGCRNIEMGTWKTQQFYGICPYLMLLEAWYRFYHSFLATHCCHHVLTTNLGFFLKSPWNRNVFCCGWKGPGIWQHWREKMWNRQVIPRQTGDCWKQYNKLQKSPLEAKFQILNWGFRCYLLPVQFMDMC